MQPFTRTVHTSLHSHFAFVQKLWFFAPQNTVTTMITSSIHLIGVSPDTNNEPTILTFGRPCTHTHQCDPQKSRFIKSMFLLKGSRRAVSSSARPFFGSFDLTLSITAMEGDPMVLREPQHRCRVSLSRLRNDKTVTPCALCHARGCVTAVSSSLRACETLTTGC